MNDYRHMSLKTSKFISFILRHKPSAAGIQLDSQGWANVDELLTALSNHTYPTTHEELEAIVSTDDKHRYSFSDDGLRIRANQGHSIPVDLGLQEVQPPGELFHGTASRTVADINKTGLLPMKRQHVHLSLDIATANKVGSRHGEPVVFSVNAQQMYADGHKFYCSENGVWLTDKVPVKYLTKKC